MKVFISGATGVLGRRVVKRLVAQGHPVVGLSRSAENEQWLRQNGAEPRMGDLFDPEAVRRLSADCQAILHLATAIPNKSRSSVADWALNDRIRREGTDNLINATLQNGCELFVQQSITFIYGDRQGGWVDETTALPAQQPPILQSAVDMENRVHAAVKNRNLPAVVLRFGAFYSHDSAQTASMLDFVRKGFFPRIGNGAAIQNLIHVDDAAEAVCQAVSGAPAGRGKTYNVCDNEPVAWGTLLSFVSQSLKARPPMGLPVFLAKMMLGSHVVETLTASARCKNTRIQTELGWQPHYPDYRTGYAATIQAWLAEQKPLSERRP